MADVDWKKIIEAANSPLLKELERLYSSWEGEVGDLQMKLLKMLITDYIPEFQTEKGRLLFNQSNIKAAIALEATFNKFDTLFVDGYMKNYATNILKFIPLTGGYYKGIGVKEALVENMYDKINNLLSARIGVKVNEAGKVTGLIADGYLAKVAKAEPVREELKNFVLQNISGRTNYRDFLKGITEKVTGREGEFDGRLLRYMRQYTYDLYQQSQRTVSLIYADNLGLNYAIYAGTLIETSRPFCEQYAETIVTREQIAEFDTMEWAGKIPDVPFTIACGGYQCRHVLNWITDEAVEYMQEGAGQMKKPSDINKDVESKIKVEEPSINELKNIEKTRLNNRIAELKNEIEIQSAKSLKPITDITYRPFKQGALIADIVTTKNGTYKYLRTERNIFGQMENKYVREVSQSEIQQGIKKLTDKYEKTITELEHRLMMLGKGKLNNELRRDFASKIMEERAEEIYLKYVSDDKLKNDILKTLQQDIGGEIHKSKSGTSYYLESDKYKIRISNHESRFEQDISFGASGGVGKQFRAVEYDPEDVSVLITVNNGNLSAVINGETYYLHEYNIETRDDLIKFIGRKIMREAKKI